MVYKPTGGGHHLVSRAQTLSKVTCIHPKMFMPLCPPPRSNQKKSETISNIFKIDHRVGGFNPSEKYESQLGRLFPTEWKNKKNPTTNQRTYYDN